MITAIIINNPITLSGISHKVINPGLRIPKIKEKKQTMDNIIIQLHVWMISTVLFFIRNISFKISKNRIVFSASFDLVPM